MERPKDPPKDKHEAPTQGPRTAARGRGTLRRVQPIRTQGGSSVPEGSTLRGVRLRLNEEPQIQQRVDSLNFRWPGLAATDAYVTVEYSRSGFGIPQTEPEYWITAVATVPDETIAQLVDNNIGDTSLLPGIYPGLYEHVPQNCQFTTIDAKFADDRLGIDIDKATKGFTPIPITGFAVSKDCHLVVMTALGHDYTPPS